MARHQLALRHRLGLEQETVLIRLQLQIVPQTDGRHDDAHLLCERLAHTSDAVEQIAALVAVCQSDKAVAQFDLHRVHVEERFKLVASAGGFGLRARACGTARRRALRLCLECFTDGRSHRLLILQRARQKAGDACENKERKHWQARHECEDQQHAGENHHRTREEQQLLAQFNAERVLGGRARDEDARRRRGHERRDLRDETIADGQKSEALQRLRHAHALLHDADGEAANDVDERNEHRRDGVAAHELARAVHRAVEVSLLLDFAPAFTRLRFVNDAGVEFGVDGHLLAGHRVQGETGGNFRDAACALGDHDEVDDDQDEEHHQPNDIVPTHDEVAERLNDVAGIAVEQNEPRGGDVERKPEQRDKEQQCGECRKVSRLLYVKDDQQHQDRQRDADGEEAVEQERRHRQDHQQDGPEQAESQQQVAVPEQAGEV